MGFFGSNKKLESDEYKKLAVRITDVESEITKLFSKFMTLRGLVHRKFTGEVEADKEPEENKIDDGFDEIRRINKAKKSD